MCDTWPWSSRNQIKTWRTSLQEDIVNLDMNSTCNMTKTVDRFNSSGLEFTYPMNSQHAPGRNRAQLQPYNSAQTNNTGAYHVTPCFRYRQTQAPEQVPLDWNIPLLPEICNGFPTVSQSLVQDLNSALPPFGSRVYPNRDRTSCGEDALQCFTTFTGGFFIFPSRLITHLKVSQRLTFHTQINAMLHPRLNFALLRISQLRELPFALVVKNVMWIILSKKTTKLTLKFSWYKNDRKYCFWRL